MRGVLLLSHCWFQSALSLISDDHEVAVIHDCQPQEARMKEPKGKKKKGSVLWPSRLWDWPDWGNRRMKKNFFQTHTQRKAGILCFCRESALGCSHPGKGSCDGTFHTLSTSILGPEEGLAISVGLKHCGPKHGHSHVNCTPSLSTSSTPPREREAAINS